MTSPGITRARGGPGAQTLPAGRGPGFERGPSGRDHRCQDSRYTTGPVLGNVRCGYLNQEQDAYILTGERARPAGTPWEGTMPDPFVVLTPAENYAEAGR